MARTYVLDEAYDKLDEVAEDLHIRTRFLLGYLLEEHSLGLGADNVYLVDEFEMLSLDFVRAINVSRAAAYIAAERAQGLHIKIASFTSFVVFDNLPALENLPDSFPGVRKLAGSKLGRRGTATTAINVSKRTFAWLKRRSEVVGTDIPMSMIVSSILQSVPYRDLVKAVSAEGFAQKLEKDFPETSLRSIRIPMDLHEEIQSLSGKLGIHMWRIASFLIHRDLEATQMEVTADRRLLPTNLKDRWMTLLKDVLELETKADEG
jgi:hypothetical protein